MRRSPLYFYPPGDNQIYSIDARRRIYRAPMPELPVDPGEVRNGRVADPDGWLPIICERGRSISLSRIVEDCLVEHHRVVAAPGGIFLSAAHHGTILFVAGYHSTELLGYFNLADRNCTWTPITVPDFIRRPGKGIDELLIVDNRLIAVDNKLIPKYLLEYDISAPAEPRLLKTVEFCHSTYEGTIMAAAGQRWLAVLSGSMNHGIEAQHISVWNSETLSEVGAFFQITSECGPGVEENSMQPDFGAPWKRVAFLGDHLLIDSRLGLALVDLSGLRDWVDARNPPLHGTGFSDICEFVAERLFLYPETRGATLALPEMDVVIFSGDTVTGMELGDVVSACHPLGRAKRQ